MCDDGSEPISEGAAPWSLWHPYLLVIDARYSQKMQYSFIKQLMFTGSGERKSNQLYVLLR